MEGGGIVAFGFEICVSDLRDFVDFAELVPVALFMALDVAEVETPTCLAISVNGNPYASTNSIAKCPEALNFWARTRPIY
jgi:hypothetical protein